MNIVTSANHDFAHCLASLIGSIHQHYGQRPIVYDLGLTPEDRQSMDAVFVDFPVAAATFGFVTKGGHQFVRATHKAGCIQDYWRRHDEPMMFVDADCLFRARVEEKGFDVGVTLRTRGLDVSDPFNGVLNSGVLIFNDPAPELLGRWAEQCLIGETTDQKALVEVLSETIDWSAYDRVYDWHGLKVKVFRTDDINDYHLRTGRIWHFKGVRHAVAIHRQLLAAIQAGKDPFAVYKRMHRRQRRSDLWRRLFGRRGGGRDNGSPTGT